MNVDEPSTTLWHHKIMLLLQKKYHRWELYYTFPNNFIKYQIIECESLSQRDI